MPPLELIPTKTNNKNTEQNKVMANKNNTTKQLTASEILEQMELLKTQLNEAKSRELQPMKDNINTKFDELMKLVMQVQGMDITYVSPFIVRVDRQELTNEKVLSFVGTEGKNIGELVQTFKGGGKKVKAHIGTMVSGNKLVEVKQPKANGRGTMTLFKKK
jgi:hypothetical protein